MGTYSAPLSALARAMGAIIAKILFLIYFYKLIPDDPITRVAVRLGFALKTTLQATLQARLQSLLETQAGKAAVASPRRLMLRAFFLPLPSKTIKFMVISNGK
ncbi:MAG: hypothetical protein QM529_05875 [Hydrotalea sp.]|nr:hypothetical protein [Hydrotalea sp.]